MAPATNAQLCLVQNFWDWLARAEIGKQNQDALFPAKYSPGRPIAKTTFSENFAAALQNSGQPIITPHSLRVGAASALIENNARVDEIQLMGGWTEPRSMQVCVKRSQSGWLEVAQKMLL